MIISKTKGKRILLVHDLCDHNTLDESAVSYTHLTLPTTSRV